MNIYPLERNRFMKDLLIEEQDILINAILDNKLHEHEKISRTRWFRFKFFFYNHYMNWKKSYGISRKNRNNK